jgi:nucleoredoxin
MRSLLSLLAGLLACAQAVAADQDWSAVFKEGLVDADGKPVAASTLKGKVVAVYFSAHWCPPCKAFTPKLVEFAKKHAAKLAVVFVSSDNSKAEMAGYMKEAGMPWPATPYRSASGNDLGAKHGVRGIPTLLVFGKDGQLVTKNGRNLAELEKILAK